MKVITESKLQEDMLDTTDKQDSSHELEFINIDESPFTIVREKDSYYGILGKHRITEKYDNKEECAKDLVEINWNRITQVIWAITEKYTDINKIIKDETE